MCRLLKMRNLPEAQMLPFIRALHNMLQFPVIKIFYPFMKPGSQANTLYLQFKSGIFNVQNNNIRVDIVLPDLAQMRINGAGQFVAANFLNGDKMTAFINGSGNILINDSKYNNAEYTVNGTGEIMAATTCAEEAQAQIVGSGKISIKVSNKLVANIPGSGNISFWGNPASVETQVSGSGKILKK